ncbi:hypothetical protein FB381_3219 [Nocardioides albertanoniae]|uniref:Uncharacterized protein n=1 Tax=Nocardioides albertanoniae TaxID=1175486 RepID=A0A543A9N3_9ACTN|nr:hypothetical protein [Nocardioides albertanoniae]TQL69314.1 hypothetical protein FB381_3219 [Nocardioides albertanoniae]
MSLHPVADVAGTPTAELLTPEEAMAQVHAWTTSRVVGKHAASMLEVLAALGVHVAGADAPAEILIKLAWRTPTCVELTTAWTLGAFLPRPPEAYVADRLSDLATSWTFARTANGAKLVCLVEDDA